MNSKIQFLIMDVDGSLTDGKIYMGPKGEAMKAFSIKDGYAINFILKPNGIIPVVLTARTSPIVQNRCKELGINEIHQGKVDKLAALKEIVNKSGFGNCAYFGDDMIDLQCMLSIKETGGVIGCPADAVQGVKAVADYVCLSKAGEGALREFAEWIVSVKNRKDLSFRINQAMEYILNLTKKDLILGKYIVNNDFYYMIQEYETKSRDLCQLISHRKFVDIQMIIEGQEAIEMADISGLQMTGKYIEDRDIISWKPIETMMKVMLQAGSYIILYPHNAHMCCINAGVDSKVKKIVAKVKI